MAISPSGRSDVYWEGDSYRVGDYPDCTVDKKSDLGEDVFDLSTDSKATFTYKDEKLDYVSLIKTGSEPSSIILSIKLCKKILNSVKAVNAALKNHDGSLNPIIICNGDISISVGIFDDKDVSVNLKVQEEERAFTLIKTEWFRLALRILEDLNKIEERNAKYKIVYINKLTVSDKMAISPSGRSDVYWTGDTCQVGDSYCAEEEKRQPVHTSNIFNLSEHITVKFAYKDGLFHYMTFTYTGTNSGISEFYVYEDAYKKLENAIKAVDRALNDLANASETKLISTAYPYISVGMFHDKEGQMAHCVNFKDTKKEKGVGFILNKEEWFNFCEIMIKV